MLQLIPDCHAPYSWELEDMGSYDPGWNHSARDNNCTSTSSPWEYQTQSQLRAYPAWGKIALYRGGGFLTELGPDLQNANRYMSIRQTEEIIFCLTRVRVIKYLISNSNIYISQLLRAVMFLCNLCAVLVTFSVNSVNI